MAERLMPLPRMLLRNCRRHLWRVKLLDSTGRQLTGGGLLSGALALMRLLQRDVLSDKEKMVGVLLPPSVAATLVNAALSLMRRVPVNLNYTLPAEAIDSCVAQCGIQHVLTSRRMMDKMKITLAAEVVCLEDLLGSISWRDKLAAACGAYVLPVSLLERLLSLHTIDCDDLLTVSFTSGSTGEPKGVMLSHQNIASNLQALFQIVELRRSDVALGLMPFFHSYGFTFALWGGLTLDPQVVYHHNPLDARQVGELCRDHGVTILMATPTLLRIYLRRCEPDQFANLKIVFAGAEKLPLELAHAFQEKFGVPISEAYGATELSPLAMTNVPPRRPGRVALHFSKEGSVGRPLQGVSARIVHPDTGDDLAPDQPGVLLVKGPNVMRGYLGKAELTAQVIRDGWYVTGDIATMDAQGFITIHDRQSRFSKIGGEMVPHLKIEETLARILGSDDEIQAVVTAIPDVQKGERLVVVHKPVAESPEQICRELTHAGLPNLWIPSPDSFVEIDEIPLLGTGKPDLKRLKALALEKLGSCEPIGAGARAGDA
ncbi:MAG: AMP-binding protein [Planctomycetes bacterium]|nr:AMP-binding protein [Planctomycetota bacterium]